ncbi:alpha/beta hydrolase [Scytonema hofmannii FACHB-248]|uniref:Alpha/beta hydrolase n=1 Tax=Scytonema hofmannii FACHB-248 TaxID=1842502 RepID=A0ABR8GMB3_9CYAN|nr:MULTISPECIES: alpha/beta hydrolase [Nostocales]MBD2604562.1 alpha/beta hydrolase [Scytonema hofmannii FACHB-248]
MRCQFLSVCNGLVLVIIIYFILSGVPALAAETVVLKYRIFRESVSVQELSTFAQTGKLSTTLRVNLALARQNPQAIRQYLTQPVKVNPVILDKVLNSRIGNVILDQLTQVIHTRSRQADKQALRGALVVSASKDRQITLIEVIQNYPTKEVEVEGDRLEAAYHQLRRLQGNLQDILGF